MKFDAVHIENFKGITQIDLLGLTQTIIIAGPNGCGKSSIFDALRLWKSAYAGYQGEEVQWWLQEFGLQGGQTPFSKILQSPDKPLVIHAQISLSESEKTWLRANAHNLIRESVYREVVPNYTQGGGSVYMPGMPMGNSARLSSSLSVHEHLVQSKISERYPQIITELSQANLSGTLTCLADGTASKSPSLALEMVFSFFDGKSIGVIDYHGPNRTFVREEVGGINLQIQQYQQQRQNSALYNSANKYSGVKSELASAYMRDLIAAKANNATDALGLRLSETLDELFRNFFPGKKFKGVEPVADGSLKFEVETPAGSHDINDLSSGEKELLYGYLRLRNYAPQNSIILLDEPELHLNPRLTDGLIEFYHRHIGMALKNQLWMVTHSDIILRQSVGRDQHKVFHMLTAGSSLAKPNQALEIMADGDIQRAVIDLVGDLAAYKPGAKLVFLEGGGSSNIDEYILTNLFPEFAQAVNLVSSGGKARVKQIANLIERASASGAIVGKSFAITDMDNDEIITTSHDNILQWDHYHIENYLLDCEMISRVIVDLNLGAKIDARPAAILALLQDAARETLPTLVRHELEDSSSKALVRAVSANTDRAVAFDPAKLHEALKSSRDRIEEAINGEYSISSLTAREQKLTRELEDDLTSGGWLRKFRGRDVLKNFLRGPMKGIVRYEVFRDLIIAKMRLNQLQPEGMKAVIEHILDA